MSLPFPILKQFLKQQPFLQNIPTNSIVSFAKNQLIFREGEIAKNFYLLYQGRVRLVKHHPDGGFRFTLTLVRGSSLGLPAMLGCSSYTASAVAITSVQIYPVPKNTLQQFLQAYPSYHSLIAKRLANTVTYYEEIISC